MIQWPNIGLYGELVKCVDDVIAALNTNFFLLDILVQASFIGFVADEDALPLDPEQGDTYINQETGEINSYRNGEWIIISAQPGWRAWLQETNELYYYDGTEWALFSSAFISSISSSTDDALVRWDGSTGKIIQNSVVTLTDAGVMSGLVELNVDTINSDEIFTTEITSGRAATDKLETGLFDAEYQAISVPTGSVTLAALTKVIVKIQSAITEINGIDAPTIASLNRFHVLVNELATDEILINNSSGNIRTGTGEDLILLPGASVWMMYDKILDLWRVVGGSGSGGGASPTPIVDLRSGNGVLTSWTLSAEPGLTENLAFYMDGVRQSTLYYSVSGFTVTTTFAPYDGAELMFVTGEVNTINVPANGSVTMPKLAADVLSALTPIGSPIATFRSTPPTNHIFFLGQTLNRIGPYAALFAEVGTVGGVGNGTTTFVLPNLKGAFLRGVDAGAGVDPNAAARTAQSSGGATGDNPGSFQSDAVQDHIHVYGRGVPVGNTVGGVAGSNGVTDQLQNANTTGMTSGNVSTETRPKNVAVNWMARY